MGEIELDGIGKDCPPSAEKCGVQGKNGNRSGVSSSSKGLSINRYVIVVILCLYCLLAGPAYFNWTAVSDILMQSGTYEWKCTEEELSAPPPDVSFKARCKAQEMAVNHLFVIASSSHFFCSFLGGLFLDVLGPKLTGMIGTGLMFVGWLLLGLASESFSAYPFAAFLIGMSVDTAFFPCLSVANLFPGRGSTVIAFLGCFRSLAFVVPLSLRAAVITRKAATTRQALLVYAGLFLSLCFLTSTFLLPKKAFPKPGDTEDEASETGEKGRTQQLTACDTGLESHAPTERETKLQALRAQAGARLSAFGKEFCSFAYVPLLPLYCFLLTNIIFYVPSALHLLPVAYEANQIVQTFSFLPCPVLGLLADRLGILPVMHFTNLCGLLAYVCVIIPSVPAYTFLQFLSTVLFAVQCSFLMSQLYCYVSVTFSQENMGSLVGLVSAVGGLFSLVTGPMRSHALAHGFLPMCLVGVVLGGCNAVILMFLHYLAYRRKKRELDEKGGLSITPSAV